MNRCRNCSKSIPQSLVFCSYNCILDFINKKETTLLYILFEKIKEFGKNIENGGIVSQIYVEEIRKISLKSKHYKKMSFDEWLKWKGITEICNK